jgi:hypothetical protein
MKSLLAFGFLVVALTGCGADNKASLQDITIGTEKLENSWDKAVSDTRNEYDRTENRVDETLVKANEDAVNEEHAVTGRTKDTLAKANADVLDEEATTTGRVKDTLAQANEDAVIEEHVFNDRFKTTSKKANMDTVAEGDKLTDRLVGSDDKTVDDHGDRIRELERRMTLVEQLNSLQSQLLVKLEDKLASEIGSLEARITSAMKSDFDTLKTLIDALGQALDQEVLNRETADQELKDLIYAEAAAREAGDEDLADQLADEIDARETEDNCLSNRISAVKAAIDNQCQITVGTKTTYVPFVSKKANVTLNCLGKTPTILNNVIFAW